MELRFESKFSDVKDLVHWDFYSGFSGYQPCKLTTVVCGRCYSQGICGAIMEVGPFRLGRGVHTLVKKPQETMRSFELGRTWGGVG